MDSNKENNNWKWNHDIRVFSAIVVIEERMFVTLLKN